MNNSLRWDFPTSTVLISYLCIHDMLKLTKILAKKTLALLKKKKRFMSFLVNSIAICMVSINVIVSKLRFNKR